MADLKAKVSVERLFHEMLKELAQDLFNTHRIKINTVQFKYQIIESIGLPPEAVRVLVETECTYMPEGDIRRGI